MPVRIGICSWADEGLLTRWYPRGVSSPRARLVYYADRFDTVEVDSPFYRLPAPETAARWAERTPPGFIFHAKASKAMTGHAEAPLAVPSGGRASFARSSVSSGEAELAFRKFREALAPLEASGKLRGVLLQYPPGFVKSREALAELAAARGRLDPLVPLVEFRHRSWMVDEERAGTLAFLERNGLAYVSVDSPATTAANVLPRLAARTHEVAYVRFHGRNARTWNARTRTSGERFDWLYDDADLREWVPRLAALERGGEVYAMFNNNRHDYAPRSATLLRRLLDEADVPASGAVERQAVPTLFD